MARMNADERGLLNWRLGRGSGIRLLDARASVLEFSHRLSFSWGFGSSLDSWFRVIPGWRQRRRSRRIDAADMQVALRERNLDAGLRQCRAHGYRHIALKLKPDLLARGPEAKLEVQR